MPSATSASLPIVRVSEIGEYIRHRSCERRFKLEINHRAEARRLPFAERLFNTLDPVLKEAGRAREAEWERSLTDAGLVSLTGIVGRPESPEDHPTWEIFAEAAAELAGRRSAYGREVAVEADVGAFHVQGRIDFLVLHWRDGRPVLRVVECKASRRDRTYQRIQVALYKAIVCQLMESQPLLVAGIQLTAGDVECVVARIDEATNESQAILGLEPLDLSMEQADVERLLAREGALDRIRAASLDDLSYQLDQKCDGCVFNVDCLPESARARRHELLGISASTATALRDAGVATLDDLAELDLNGPSATALRGDPSFSEHLERLRLRARVRRRTLPGGDLDPDTYEVTPLPRGPASQLPEHDQAGQRLVRIYLSIDYDYTENRVGALAAHVTRSDGQLHTGFVEAESRWAPDPQVRERIPAGEQPDSGQVEYEERPLAGRDVIKFKGSEWTGDHRQDTGAERELIQEFIWELIDAIAEVAEAPNAPIHFYVWSRSEMAQLVEACSRASSRLLGALRELLGCRDSLEQLIYSCLQDEVDRRYALGWTGRGLAVVTSLRWFGQRYHWTRRAGGEQVDLDRVFTQDIFDFKTDLDLAPDGTWAQPSKGASRHKFEIRSRFHDSLTAPYWRALWGTLPDPDSAGLKADERNAIRRYSQAAQPGRLREYLRARAHALRWVEERVRFKNREISKPSLAIAELQRFRLGVDDAAQAAIDFLRLDQFVKVTDWAADHLVPPATRVPTGRTIPVAEVISQGSGSLTARIDLDGFDIDLATLETRCPIVAGSFVRLSPCFEDPHAGQTIGQLMRGGRTCVVQAINWETGQVTLEERFSRATRYALASGTSNEPGDVFDHATIDDSVTDFVAGRVERQLLSGRGAYASQWFDPEDPQVPEADPLPPSRLQELRRFLEVSPISGDGLLAPDQVEAVLAGMEARVQLLQGPPGTGKTMTTAVALLLRIAERLRPGAIVLLAAHTHTAVDNLLLRVAQIEGRFRSEAAAAGLRLPPVTLAKVHSSNLNDPLDGVVNFVSRPSATTVNRQRRNAVLVVGGTTGALLKLADELSRRRPWRDEADGFQVPMLMVDEASMMVFPHFLALATLVRRDGEIMLTGDHRQLEPIVAHDWEREDRPPAVLYQPFASAYNAVRDIAAKPEVTDRSVRRSALQFTFRLPPPITQLISRLYRLDQIELEGLPRPAIPTEGTGRGKAWDTVWQGDTGLFLVLHSESRSRQSNETEVEIIRELLAASGELPDGSVAVITPHRAQRSLLQSRLRDFARPVGVIDTVERLQGGERPVVIVSGTASDPSAISINAEFLLDLNRSNVAFSRTRDRLVVVCARTLLEHVPADLEQYQSAMLWKSLRALCNQRIARHQVNGHDVEIFTVSAAVVEQRIEASAQAG